ncbi:MAG: STAS domain-containing protein [Pseudomonadota bacterium]
MARNGAKGGGAVNLLAQPDGKSRLSLVGSVDLAHSEHLLSAMPKNFSAIDGIDVAEVHAIDSAGLAIIVWIKNQVRNAGGNAGISGVSDEVKSLSNIYGLDLVDASPLSLD